MVTTSNSAIMAQTNCMPCVSSVLELGGITLSASSGRPLYLQIYQKVRESVLAGQFAPGMRLPPTRELAGVWGVSRSTVVLAFDHLIAEGYLEARVGAGTFVSSSIPDTFLHLDRGKRQGQVPHKQSPEATRAELSRRGQLLWDQYQTRRRLSDHPCAFRPGVPALGTFPLAHWRRLSAHQWRNLVPQRLVHFDSMGHPPLREAVASYLQATRGVQCEAEQVIITTSTQHALLLAAQVLLDSGDPIWIEDPCYHRAEASLASTGARLIPIPVDEEGLDLEAGMALGAPPRMVYITPSHQYPLGITMSLPRRLELLDWARQQNVWIMEDDYISEYRFEGKPLTALQGLDTSGRVLYMGTFSKVFTPALRLGYLVVPPSLVEPFRAIRSLLDKCPAFIDQAVLADFINEGHFSHHIRRMRILYAERREALRAAILEEATDLLELDSVDAGLHVLAWLPNGVEDREITRCLAENGIMAPCLSYFFHRPPPRGALVLGFAGWSPPELRASVRAMARSMRGLLGKP